VHIILLYVGDNVFTVCYLKRIWPFP